MSKVLVVDDEEQIRRFLVRLVSLAGHEAVEAKDGEDGLSLLKEDNDFGLIITDIDMPRMNGVSMLESISFRIPAFVITGNHGAVEDYPCLNQNGIVVFTKPLDISGLLFAVKKALT